VSKIDYRDNIQPLLRGSHYLLDDTVISAWSSFMSTFQTTSSLEINSIQSKEAAEKYQVVTTWKLNRLGIE
jgi:hypothetical protein